SKCLERIDDPHLAMDRDTNEEALHCLLRHRIVRLHLATDRLVYCLCDGGELETLNRPLPHDLIREVAKVISLRGTCIDLLTALLRQDNGVMHAMAASILVAAGVPWRPQVNCHWRLGRAYLRGVRWPNVDLFQAHLPCADLQDADLNKARLSGVNAR